MSGTGKKQICTEADVDRPFELGFATFYLNRCNRSGVLFGAAPIGGYEQKGKWRMDARFYRATLAQRIRFLADRKEQIHITCQDALHFLREITVPANQQNRIFTYLDPPYYMDGNRLYLNKYQDEDHSALAHEVKTANELAWLASYNNVHFIRDLYSDSVTTTLPVRYSMQKKQIAEELIITSPGITLPDNT